jgi:4-alpha-glucanotransferase
LPEPNEPSPTPGRAAQKRNPNERRVLRRLAKSCGVATSYFDIVAQRRRAARSDALRAVLAALGIPAGNPAEIAASFAERRAALWGRLCEPVIVAWGGRRIAFHLHLEGVQADGAADCELTLETGERRTWRVQLGELEADYSAEVDGRRFAAKRLELYFTSPRGHRLRLPYGYHRLAVEVAGRRAGALVISAPSRAWTTFGDHHARESGGAPWGVFAPLYALNSGASWGIGDFSELERMAEWIAGLGGSLVGTLPLLACFLGEAGHPGPPGHDLYEPSPYVPVSRRFWNEVFIDVMRSPELSECVPAKELMNSAAFREEIAALRRERLVDYRRAMSAKRRVLELLARHLHAGTSARREELEGYVDAHPVLQDYARFRATCARRGQVWHVWPGAMREGRLAPGDWDEDARRYHLYVQWLAHEQLGHFARRGREKGVGLYLDLPLGVHPDGYDVWRDREAFARGVSGGAPPDNFFVRGQDWGFPPLHPERIREQGHAYFIACVRHHLQYAGVLRIDHVMGLHRLFWVPHGMDAARGVYVHYRAGELYAILALESWRRKAVLVGEDLGTVPRYVRPMMQRRGIQRMYVAQFEVEANPEAALRPVYPEALAGVNTHDTPSFAGFWEGADIRDAAVRSLFSAEAAERQLEQRRRNCEALAEFLRRMGLCPPDAGGPVEILRGVLRWLGASPARVVVASLEDLWGEPEQQNTPGTRFERANWRRKFQHPVEAFRALPEVEETLKALAGSRRAGEKE